MKNIARMIEVIANVAIICVAISLGVVLISRTIRSYRGTVAESANTPPVKDQKIQLPGVDWSKNEQTLVMAISSTCHFCTESAGFYRDIRTRARVHTVAVLPQSVDEGRKYLSSLGVQVDEVLQAPLSSMDVSGTPTLLLVNRNGTVIRKWIGKLPADLEKEVLLSVGAEGKTLSAIGWL
jgi:hypothetical protein